MVIREPGEKGLHVIITECVLHGFKGFVAPFTLRLKPGLNLVTGGNESGKSTLCEAILSVLFASPSSSAFLNWYFPEACRILLVFSTPRGRFRTLKDFIRRSADLSIWDPAKAAFLSTAQNPSQVAGLLSKELGEVTEAVYRTLYVLQPPSRSPVAQAPEVTASPEPASPAIAPRGPRQKQQDRLQQLRGYLKTYREIRETELLLDSLRNQHEETGASLHKLGTLEAERRTLREALARFQPLESFTTSSLLAQIAEYQKALENRDGEARGLQEKAEDERDRLALIPSVPLWRLRLLHIGGGLVIVSFAAGQFLPYAGTGIMLGLGCIAAGLTQYLNWSQKRDKIQKGILAIEHQVAKGLDLRISRQFQPLLDLVPRVGCHEVSELATRIRQRDTFRERLATLDRQIAELSAGIDPTALEEQKGNLEETIRVAEGELGALGYVPEASDIQREIEELERGTVSPEEPAPPSRERASQSVTTLLTTLERVLRGLSPSLLSAIETQASKLISEITAGRYTRIHRTPESSLRLTLAGGQGERSLGEVSDGAQDQALLAWHLALLTVMPQAPSVPLLLDEPFLRVDGERRKRLLPFLQSLARTHQVILFSQDAWIPPEVAHTIPLARAIDRLPSSKVA